MKKLNSEIEQQIKNTLENFSALNRIFIGYSGGVDSHVLLNACAKFSAFKDKIIAVYVHHGLQKEADDWAIHCQNVTQNLGVAFLEKKVNAFPVKRESPEEAARNARYAVFKTLVEKNDLLLIAQHQEDQLETVLLQLFRGAGLKGLSGMPEKMPFGEGYLIRPFLQISKETINAYASAEQLVWIEDPSNQNIIYDRNFLRQEILPKLKQRWKALDKTVSRTATHCSETEQFMSKIAKTYFETVFNSSNQTIEIKKLITYSEFEQRLILRQWFKELGLKMPSQDFLQRILDEVVGADSDRHPILQKRDITIRRIKGQLTISYLQ